jgi:membrane-associated phospholipid phosphatase
MEPVHRPWWRDLRELFCAAVGPARHHWPLAVILFAVATYFMLWASGTGADRAWLDWLITDRSPGLLRLAKWLSKWGELHFLPVFLALLLWGAGRFWHRLDWRLAGAAGLLGAAGAGLAGLFLKILYGRPRPHLAMHDGLHGLSWHWDFQSFPSGHSSHCWGLVAGVSMLAPRWAVPYGVFAAAVCWSRMYLERHYFTDLFGGLVVGVFVGSIFGLAARDSLARLRAVSPSPAPAAPASDRPSSS